MKTKGIFFRRTATAMIIIMMMFSARSYSQIFTGGTTSVNWNNGIYVDLAPIIGYQIQSFKVGLSPIGSYSTVNGTSGVYSFGGRVFTEYTVWKGIFLHAEFEGQNVPVGSSRSWIFAAPVGVGYEYPIMKGVMLQGSVLWDFMQQKNNPKENPIIRGGIIYTL